MASPWNALNPEYESAATQLKGRNVQLVRVDCTEHQDLCQEFGIEGYPSLKIFRGLGNIAVYTGARRADAYVFPLQAEHLCLPVMSQSELEAD